jgi:hypothetical protein
METWLYPPSLLPLQLWQVMRVFQTLLAVTADSAGAQGRRDCRHAFFVSKVVFSEK